MVTESQSLGSTTAADPYLAWANLTRHTDFLDASHPSGFSHGVAVEFNATGDLVNVQQELAREGKFANWYDQNPSLMFATGWVTATGLRILAGSKCVKRFEQTNPLRVQRRPARVLSQGAQLALQTVQNHGASNDTLLGAIDTGCPFAHRGLCWEGNRLETRISAIWDQDLRPAFGRHGSVPATMGYGKVVDQETMNTAIRFATRAGSVDESAAYSAIAYGDLRVSRTHGSHVLGLMAGYSEKTALTELELPEIIKDRAVDSEIAFVQLPRDLYHAPSRAALGHAVIDGVAWLALHAHEKSKSFVVISVPYGSVLGPHDGTSIIERALDEVIQYAFDCWGVTVRVLLAAGNSFLAKGHAMLPSLRSGETVDLIWRVPQESELPSFLELWLPQDATAEVTLFPPGESSGVSASLGHACAWPTFARPACGIVASDWRADNARLVLLRVAPTRACDGSAIAAAGDWKIQVVAGVRPSKTIHAYAPRARGSFGAALRGRQSYLVKPLTGGMWQVTGEGTLNGFGGGTCTTLVGGYIKWSTRYEIESGTGNWKYIKNPPAVYTSSGPNRSRGKIGPDYSMQSDFSRALMGVRSIGTRSGSTFRMDGSSVAVPQVARVVAQNPGTMPPKTAGDARLGTRLS